MVPTHFHAIFALEKSVRDRWRGVALKALVSNAAPLPQRTKETIVHDFGDGILHETYGSTEGGIVTNLRPPDQLRKQQCVGRPFLMNQVRLLGEEGKPVAAGEVGELYNNSPCLFLGYWNQPEATAATMRDGWFSAGDLARMDEEGYLYLVDRKKDMYISGGVNVYPRRSKSSCSATRASRRPRSSVCRTITGLKPAGPSSSCSRAQRSAPVS